MSLDDVANITRVPTRHLEHIDRGEWDALPAITYSVGFARAYANAVGLNGAEIGAELRGQLGTSHGNAAATAYYEPADPARVPPRSLALIAGAVAVLLAIGYAIWRSSAVAEEDPQAEAAAVETPLVAPEPTAQPNAAAGQPLGGPSPAAAGSGPVILTAVDDVWLRVYEAGGSVLYENILKAGERYEVPSNAQRPQIRAGRPEALRVTVGQTAVPQLGPTGQAIGDVSLLPADLLRTAPAGAPAPAPAATAPAPAPTR
jgi:cytoskeletal protein RodZ